MFWEQGVLEISKKRKKISKSRYKSRQFPRKIYLNEFSCSQVTDQTTTLPINELLHMYISRILPIFSSSQWLLQKVYKRREIFLENKLVSHPRMNSSIGAESSSILAKFYNHFHNILRLFDILPNFSVTASETMRDYYL